MTVFKSLRVRASQGTQYIADLRKAVPGGFRGLPVIRPGPCDNGCSACRDVCPTRAIELEHLRLDLGRCVFCNACAELCPKIEFTSNPRMAAASARELIVREGDEAVLRVRASEAFS